MQDPHLLFDTWFAEAKQSEPRVPDAMQLATTGAHGPRIRTVLCKDASPDGFVFYTNLGSAKVEDLRADPRCGITFHWKSLERQVHALCTATPIADDVADAYWQSRVRGSQIGAWASHQSQTTTTPLATRVAAMEAKFDGVDVPRPAFWSGFLLVPHTIEFWQGHPDRLHERWLFERSGGQWAMRVVDP